MGAIITSKSNTGVKYVKKLISSAKERRESGKFVLEGLRLCRDAMQNGRAFSEAFYTKAAFEKNPDDMRAIIGAARRAFEVTDEVFAAMSDTVTPQGVLCVAENDRLLDAGIKPSGKYIVLHSVANPDNVGAIARTAEAFGLSGLIVIGGCDVFSPKALRASMGALLRIPVTKMSEQDFLQTCDKYKIAAYASTPDSGAVPLADCRFDQGCAVVIGNEANGLPQEFIDKCRSAVTIKMSGRAESLNAAAAAAVLIYEMTK